MATPHAPARTLDEIVSAFFNASRQLKHKLYFGGPLSHLSLSHMETLRLIGDRQPVLMKEVADFLAITPPSATVLINHLVKAGLVKRATDQSDRRSIKLLLTKKGAKALSQAIAQRCQSLKKLLGRLSLEEQSSFLRLIKKMNE